MSKFQYEGYAQPSVWLTRIYRVRYNGQYLGSVAKGFGGWVILLDDGGTDFGYQTRNAAAERLLVRSGLNPVAKAALPDDPFEGLA